MTPAAFFTFMEQLVLSVRSGEMTEAAFDRAVRDAVARTQEMRP